MSNQFFFPGHHPPDFGFAGPSVLMNFHKARPAMSEKIDPRTRKQPATPASPS